MSPREFSMHCCAGVWTKASLLHEDETSIFGSSQDNRIYQVLHARHKTECGCTCCTSMHDISDSAWTALALGMLVQPYTSTELATNYCQPQTSLCPVLPSPSPGNSPTCLQLHDLLRCPPDLTRTCCDCGDSSPLDRHHHEAKDL